MNKTLKMILISAAALLLISALSACSLVKMVVPETSGPVETEAETPAVTAPVAEAAPAKTENEPEPQAAVTEEPAPVQETTSSVSESEPSPATPQPFYGIWVAAFKDEQSAKDTVSKLKEKGFDAVMLISSQWSNLNQETWYIVSAGSYTTKDAAQKDLPSVQAAGYSDAYIKHTGDWKG